MENCYGRRPSNCECQIIKDKGYVCSDAHMGDCTFYKGVSKAIDDYLRCKDSAEPGKITKSELVDWVERIQSA